MNPLVEVQDVRVVFPGRLARPDRVAVAGVSFHIDSGETLGLVGESGSGKSTLARAILGLRAVTSGVVRFDGGEVTGRGRRRLAGFRRRAQMVFQDPLGSLNPRMTAGDTVEEVFRVRGLSRASARSGALALLERVGLGGRVAEALPHRLSGGQLQRVGIARALATEPDFLVLDEPVSALDVSVQAQVLNLLLSLQRELGLTYLFISHDLAVVRRMSDRIAVMQAGRLVESGPTTGVILQSKHPYTRTLIRAAGAGSTPGPRARGEG